jgi:hypothetical protein
VVDASPLDISEFKRQVEVSKTKGMIKLIREKKAQELELCPSIFSKSSRKRKRVIISPEIKKVGNILNNCQTGGPEGQGRGSSKRNSPSGRGLVRPES